MCYLDDQKATENTIFQVCGLKGRGESSTGCFALDFAPPFNDQVSCGLGGFGALHHKPTNKITDEKECIII